MKTSDFIRHTLKNERARRHMSIREFADFVGTSPGNVIAWETGKRCLKDIDRIDEIMIRLERNLTVGYQPKHDEGTASRARARKFFGDIVGGIDD